MSISKIRGQAAGQRGEAAGEHADAISRVLLIMSASAPSTGCTSA